MKESTFETEQEAQQNCCTKREIEIASQKMAARPFKTKYSEKKYCEMSPEKDGMPDNAY